MTAAKLHIYPAASRMLSALHMRAAVLTHPPALLRRYSSMSSEQHPIARGDVRGPADGLGA